MFFKTVYASMERPQDAEQVVRKILGDYRIEGSDGHLLLYRLGDFDPVDCRISIRKEDESADAFTEGRFSRIESLSLHDNALKNEILAHFYYTNVIVLFETERYTSLNAAIFDDVSEIVDELGAIYEDNSGDLLACSFANGSCFQYYNGVILDWEEKKSSRNSGDVFHTIARSEFVRCGDGEGRFKDTYEKLEHLEEQFAWESVPQMLRHLCAEGKHYRVIAIAEAIPETERDCVTAAALGMAYYARSYFFPNASAMREKAERVIRAAALTGENNAYWQHALSYVLHVSNPLECAKHLEKACALDPDVPEHGIIQNRLEQVKRDEAYAKRRAAKKTIDPQREPFADFSHENFWDDCEYSLENYVFNSPSDAMIAEVEMRLGYKLPHSYIQFMKQHNGGMPHKTFRPSKEPTSWSEAGAEINGFFGIEISKDYSLCGGLGSRSKIESWAYPDIGVYIADTPTAGHDMIALDYRYCGPNGEPEVVHVAQNDFFTITYLADDFESFICGLTEVPEE